MKQIIGLSLLLAVALAASYATWTSDAPKEVVAGESSTVVIDATDKDLQKIHWESAKLSVDLARKTDAKGDYVWVDAIERKEVVEKPPAKDPAAPDDPAAEDAPEEPATPEEPAPAPVDPAAPVADKKIEEKAASFRGGDAADKLWADFAPLEALRELTLPQGADLAQYGLDAPVAKVTVTRTSGATEIEVGGETYGAKDRYVRVNGKVYLLAQDALRPLEFAATRLVERRLNPFVEDAIDAVAVETPDGKQLAFVQTNKDDKEKAFWAKADAPGDEFKSGDAWLGKLLKLNAKLYVDEGTLTGPLTPVFSYTATSAGESWKTEILRVDGETPEFYARSEFGRGLVSLSRTLASEVSADLADLVQ